MRIVGGGSRLWAHVCVLALACLAAACASHRPASLADRFVRHATEQDLEDPDLYDPAAGDDRGRPADAAPIVLSSEARAAAALVESTGFKPAESTGPTVETTSDRLADALTSLSSAPSGDRHRRVGAEYRRLKVFDVARRHLDRAIVLNRRDAEAYDERARLWRDAGSPELALGDAHRAVSFAPGSATAHNTLGTVRYALGDGDGARQAFERVIALDASAAYAYNNLCYLAHLRGDDAGALEHCGRALALAPDLAVAWNNLGLVHAAAGRMADARAAFIAGSGRAQGLYNVGIAYLARREYGDAAEAFDAALREQPEMMDAVRRAAEARALADARDGGPAALSLARSRK